MKNLFEINESLLVFDIRDVAGVSTEQDNFVKEILLRTVKNIKRFCQVLNKDTNNKGNNENHIIKQIVQSWESLPILNKVQKQIIKLVQNEVEYNNQLSESKNQHNISNLFRDEANEDDEDNELNYNNSNSNKQSNKNLKGYIKDNRNQLNLAKGKVNQLSSKTSKTKLKTTSDAIVRPHRPATAKRNLKINYKTENSELDMLRSRCKELENRCLSLALENKLLRNKSTVNSNKVDKTIEDIKKANKDASISLNQSNWQPTVHDLSEIALISGLSIDRTRQAFTTIIEDSAEFRQRMDDDQDTDITNRIDFLMNELNRILDGVE